MTPEDWREAFAHHPRIGESAAADGEARMRAAWSQEEQAGVTGSGRTAFAAANRAYEARFGHIYLVCASGRSGQELLDDLTARLGHDAATELRVAAGEQRRIMQLRLQKLLGHSDGEVR
jgi:2-oxo-4-hydroxy-4-carboxy-5-ureidoimidazoline decarboxylase